MMASTTEKKVLVEGTQGFGLSLYHSGLYPKTTSRDTSAAGCISECGISPRLVSEIVLVLRTFPIRVAGQQAGPMFEETDWETIQRESGSSRPLAEYTTVTRKLRRVGRFDFRLARQAAAVNRPTAIAMNFLDYISAENRTAENFEDLTGPTQRMIAEVQSELGAPVAYGGVGAALGETLYIPHLLREERRLAG